MTLVNADTGEVVVCTVDEARALTDEIRSAAERVWSLLLEAHDRRVWTVLGYDTWESYVRAEFDMSRQRSYQVLDQGRVIREIGQAAGMSTSVDITEAEARDLKPRLASVKEAVRDATTDLPPEKVKDAVRQVINEEREKARQKSEDAAALRDLSKAAKDAGLDMSGDRVRQRGEFRRLCRDLAALPEPENFLESHAEYLTDGHVEAAEAAYAWLDEFILTVRGDQ